MSHTVLVTAPSLAPSGLAVLRGADCEVHFISNRDGSAEVEARLAAEPFDGVISRTVALTAKAIRSCPTLRVIVKHGAGVNNIDVAAATECGIPVLFTPATNAQSVSEMAICLMLAVARGVGELDQMVRLGRWDRTRRSLQLSGRRLGVLGFGQIGQRVARAALGFGMHVQVFDSGLKDPDGFAPITFATSLRSLLEASDVLTLHIPLTAKTHHLIGAEQLAQLPQDAIVINTARGEIIDEDALGRALASGHLYGAGLDTLSIEPIPADSPLLRLRNVILTPHIGGSTDEALAAVSTAAANYLVSFLNGAAVDSALCVNSEVLTRVKT